MTFAEKMPLKLQIVGIFNITLTVFPQKVVKCVFILILEGF